MPRTLHPELRDCIERANPYSEYRIEISEPDVSKVLRRQDEFLSTPPLVGAMVPANSLSASARGSLILTPSPVALATYAGVAGSFDLNPEDQNRRFKGLSWTIDSAFSRATLKSIVAKVQAVPFAASFFDQEFECQIYRITRTPGVKVKNVGSSNYSEVAFTEYTFAPLLSSAPKLKVTAAMWVAASTQTLTFDFSNFGLILENTPTRAVTPDQTGELPKYLIVVRLVGKGIGGNSHFRWLTDTVASHTVASVGTFDRVFWAKDSDDAQWAEQISGDVPNVVINIEAYPASGQGIYLIDVGAVPKAASTGRIEFQRALPPGTNATVEISTAGSGGPWFPVKHGDSLSVRKNLFAYPSQFDNAAWSKGAAGGGSAPVVTPNAGVDPDGRTTAAKVVFVAPTGADQSTMSEDSLAATVTGAPYTMSYWIKAFGAGDVGKTLLYRGVGRSTYATVVLTALWQRVNAVEASFSALTYGEFALRPGLAGSSGTVSVLLWDSQLEPGSVVTDYAVNFGAPQQQYWLRTTLTSDAALHATPEGIALGVEFRIPQDVSVEGIPILPTREISLPWPKASIPEGKLRVVRTGIRDYLDIGSAIGSTAATSRLEADIFLASRHPSITRDKWFRLERMMVSNRVPSATSEEFTLLSYASRLKRKIPQKAETINSVHTVVSSTTGQVVINSETPLPGTTASPGNEYDGKAYYMRVRSTTAANIPVGFLATIQGNTGVDRLDFNPLLPQALVAGDVIEVHSGIFATQAVSWTDYDPADVWWEVLTNLLAIPTERIGIGSLPRGGKPPKVTDIAPGDATTQAKRKVTGRLSEEVEGDKTLDILSAIMGGVTLEIDGQIVFVQILPLTDLAGVVTVPLPPPAAIFDIRDFSAPPQTPPGIEQRATIVSSKYGVPATAASPDSFPSKATTAVDPDALLWLQQQDLTEYGTADVPDEISAWFYNTTDDGLYLASAIPAGLVKVASTGLRVWPLAMTEKHPNLVPGDVIVIAIDSYTDYDPATQTPIKGPIAVRGVLVRVGNEGRQLSMFVPGLRDNVQLIAGGAVGALTGLGPQPAPPVLSASFDSTGQLIINSSGDFATASQRIAWATGATPSAATVRAATPIAQQNVSGLATGSVSPAGTTVFIAAFAYSANGLESTPLAAISVTREGSGVAESPTASVTQSTVTAPTITTETLTISGALGASGTAPLVWRYHAGDSRNPMAAWSAWLPNSGATLLPYELAVTRLPKFGKLVEIQVSDAGALISTDKYTVQSRSDALDESTGRVLRAVPLDDGDYAGRTTDTGGLTAHISFTDRRARPIDTGFQYGVDGAGGVVESAGQKFTHGDQLDGNRRVANVTRGATTAEPTTNLFKRGIDTASDVIESAAQKFVHGTMLDASRFITNVYRSTVTEPVGNLFKRGVDTAADIVETTARWFTDSAMLDASRRITSVYRAATTEPVGNLFKRGVDVLGDVIDGGGFSRIQTADVLSSRINVVPYVATIGDAKAGTLAKRSGIFFSEVWDELPNTQGYDAAANAGTTSLVPNVGYGKVGVNVLRMTGEQWRMFPRALPFNPSKLYRFRVRYRCMQTKTVGGGGVYIGVLSLDSAGVATNANGGYDYVAVAGDDPTTAQGWKEVTTWVKGATTPRTSWSGGVSTDPTAPTALGVETVQIKPIYAFNYLGGDGWYELDYFQIEELDEDASDRTYTVIDTGQKLKTAAKDSRAAALNNHFRYAVDTLEGTVDGGGRFAAVEANANNTEVRTSADTAAVSGTAAATVKSGAARGQGGFDNAIGGLVTGARGKADFAVKNSGGTTSFGTNRHNDEQVGVNTATKTFGASFDSIPQIRALPQSFLIPGASSTVDRVFEFKATGVSVSGYTVRAVSSTGSTTTARTNDFAATLNGTPVGAGVAILNGGAAAYCNLANANSTLTTYIARFDINAAATPFTNTIYVNLYRNDGVSSTSWTLVGGNSYGGGIETTNETISFSAALALNWDMRIVISYETTPLTAERATVTCQQMDYDEITAGTETPITTGAGNGILFQAMEAP